MESKRVEELTLTEAKIAYCDLTREHTRVSQALNAVNARLQQLESDEQKNDSLPEPASE